MAKKSGVTYEQKLMVALKKLPNPLEDKKHNLKIYFQDNRARSNQSRFDHIVDARHGLRPSDIERIPRYINESKLKKDSERKDTYNLFIKRNTYSDEYIKIALKLENGILKNVFVKTIYITKVYKW